MSKPIENCPTEPGNYYYMDAGACNDPKCCNYEIKRVFANTKDGRHGFAKDQLLFHWGYDGKEQDIYLAIDDEKLVGKWGNRIPCNRELSSMLECSRLYDPHYIIGEFYE